MTLKLRGVVEGGRVTLEPGAALPENTEVFVVVPDPQQKIIGRVRVVSPRLVNREDVKHFVLEVRELEDDARL